MVAVDLHKTSEAEKDWRLHRIMARAETILHHSNTNPLSGLVKYKNCNLVRRDAVLVAAMVHAIARETGVKSLTRPVSLIDAPEFWPMDDLMLFELYTRDLPDLPSELDLTRHAWPGA
jgi:hypothetical protein